MPLGLALEARARRLRPGERGAAAGFRLGYLAGFVLFLAALHWIAFLSPIAVTVPGIMYPAWPAAALYLAVFPALAGALTLAARVRWGAPVGLVLPLAWLAAERLRSLGELGFPWLSLGYTQWEALPVLQWASIGGVSLVGLWVAAVNGFGIEAGRRALAGRRRSAGAGLAGALATAAIAWGGGAALLPPPSEPDGPRVALVQGNVPGSVKWDAEQNDAVLRTFLALSREALAADPDLLVWPETATGSYLRRDLEAHVRVQSFVDSAGVPLLAGYPDWSLIGPDAYETSNAAGIFRPGRGLSEQYDKVHLVPFGERLPFQRWFPFLGRLDLGQAEFTPGEGMVVLEAAGERIAPLICFESIFPVLAREARARGATLLANITNDEWFGRTGALYQHAAMSVFRAVENRMPLVRCGNTGITFFVDPSGRVRERGGVFTREVQVARIVRAGEPPPFRRWGEWPGALALGLALALAAASAWPRRSL